MNDPTMPRFRIKVSAQARVEEAALRAISADRYAPDDDPNAEAMSVYADGQLMLAARDLTRLMDALPKRNRPAGWAKEAR